MAQTPISYFNMVAEQEDPDQFSDLESSDDQAQTVESRTSALVQALNATEDDGELDLEAQLDDVDARLEIASLYRQYLRVDLFTERSPAVALVEKRIRAFVTAELNDLLGLPGGQKRVAEAQAWPFSEDETKALKTLLSKLVTGAKSEAPQLRPVGAPVEVQAVPAKPQPPQIKPVQAVQPKGKAPAKQPPKPNSSVQKRKEQQRSQAQTGKHQLVAIRESEDGHKLVTIKTPTGRLIREMVDANNKPVLRPDGQPIRQDITPPTAGTGYIPMPSQEQQQFISQQISDATLNAGIGNESNKRSPMDPKGPLKARGHGPLGAVLAQIAVNQGE